MPEDRTSEELSYLRTEVIRLRKSLNALTPPIEVLLKRRGFFIYKKQPEDDLFVPDQPYIDDYYRMLHKYSFRLFLRDAIKNQVLFSAEDVSRYTSAGVTRKYIDYLMQIGLAKSEDSGYTLSRHIRSFGATLEWFVAEVFKREFGAESIWGVKFKGNKAGGDYDLLAKFNGSLLYAEVKSSPPKQIYANEIMAFLARISELSPEISVFLMDTELRMKDKIVPMFEDALEKKEMAANEIGRIEKELFQIGDRIFIINTKDSIIHNIEVALKWYFRRKDDVRC